MDEAQLANKIRLLYEDYVNKTLDIIKDSTSRFTRRKQLRNEKKEYLKSGNNLEQSILQIKYLYHQLLEVLNKKKLKAL